MSSVDGRYHITFNGEIYNHAELRETLVAKGFTFRSSSDTEVLLALFAAHGANMLGQLRGMYAFAIWDAAARSLFLARDPYGIKPLYYHNAGGTFRFASEVQALLKSSAIARRVNSAAKASYFLFGHVMEPLTIVDGVHCLPSGSCLVVTDKGVGGHNVFASVEGVWQAGAAGQASSLSHKDRSAYVADAVVRSVEAHFVADVPVGVFLSAGVDSSMIFSASMQKGRAPPRTFTLGFDRHVDDMADEVPDAEAFARQYGTEHTTRIVTAADFERCYPHFVSAMDQPTIDGLNTYFISQAVRDQGLKVALSGVGGDELFMAYSTFNDLPKLVHALRALRGTPAIGRLLRQTTAQVLPAGVSPKLAGLVEYSADLASAYLLRRCLFAPWELASVMGEEAAGAAIEQLQALERLRTVSKPIRDPRFAVGALESVFYMRNQLLRDSDWTSMAHSVELRTPLVDWHLLNEVAPALKGPNAPSRADVARALPRPLGAEILNRKKSGFATPVRGWMIDKLAREQGRAIPVERGLRTWAKFLFDAYCDKHGLMSDP
jgi:asparagine synthase (glutamine-hydrolysing)